MEFWGIEADRYQIAWISGAEGIKFQQTMKKIVEDVKRLGPNNKLREAK